MVFQYFSFPDLQKSMKTNGFPICWLAMAGPRFSDFSRPSRNHQFQIKISIQIDDFGSRSSRSRFWRSDGPLRNLENQWKPTVFQYFSFPELQKAMKTNGFPILFLPKASKSNENQLFSNTFPSQSFKKQWKHMVFQYFSFPKLQKAMKTNGFPILFLP